MDEREGPVRGFFEVCAVAAYAVEFRDHIPELVEVGCEECTGVVNGVEVVQTGVGYG